MHSKMSQTLCNSFHVVSGVVKSISCILSLFLKESGARILGVINYNIISTSLFKYQIRINFFPSGFRLTFSQITFFNLGLILQHKIITINRTLCNICSRSLPYEWTFISSWLFYDLKVYTSKHMYGMYIHTM